MTYIPIGTRLSSIPIVIPRRYGSGITAPYAGSGRSYSAGKLTGAGPFQSIIEFDDSVTGSLVTTELFSGDAGYYWNNDNQLIPNGFSATQLAYLCPQIIDIGIHGKGVFVNFPYVQSGIHGTDFVHRADGISFQGSGLYMERVRLFQIPGWAVILNSGAGGQTGALSYHDNEITRLHNVFISQCGNGIKSVGLSDTRFEHLTIANVAGDALLIGGGGPYLFDCHTFGSTRGLVTQGEVHSVDGYFEAAHIGCEVLTGSGGSEFNGHNIGPGTCSYRGIRVNEGDVDFYRLAGQVAAGADLAGLEIAAGATAVTAKGRFTIGSGSSGILLSSGAHHVSCRLRGTTDTGSAVFRVVGGCFSFTLKSHNGYIAAGCAVDLSTSNCDLINGGGSVIDIRDNIQLAGKPILYPGYPSGGNPSNTYNLADGYRVYINGVKQKAA